MDFLYDPVHIFSLPNRFLSIGYCTPAFSALNSSDVNDVQHFNWRQTPEEVTDIKDSHNPLVKMRQNDIKPFLVCLNCFRFNSQTKEVNVELCIVFGFIVFGLLEIGIEANSRYWKCHIVHGKILEQTFLQSRSAFQFTGFLNWFLITCKLPDPPRRPSTFVAKCLSLF